MNRKSSYEILAVVMPAFLCATMVRTTVVSHSAFVFSEVVSTVAMCAIFSYASNRREAWNAWFIGGLAALPWSWALLGAAIGQFLPGSTSPQPYELLVLGSLQNIVLGLAWVAETPRLRRLAVFSSMSLTIFCVVLVPGLQIAPFIYFLAFVQAMLIVWWLMGDYWERLESGFIRPAESTRIGLRSGIAIVSIAAVSLAAMLVSSVAPPAYRLVGFLPTSGGSRWSDKRAVSGLGDGNSLVGAQDSADSFGPVDTNLFIEDQQPSLYDIANEAFGEARLNNRFNAAANLDGAKVQMNHKKLAESEKSGREFSVIRQQPSQRKKRLSEKHSDALIHYRGEVPQRLAINTFNEFDGEKWTNRPSGETSTERVPTLEHDTNGKPWIVVDQAKATTAEHYQHSAVRWLGLNSNRITTPDQLAAVHIDRIDRQDFFAWTSDDILEMPERDRVPIFTTVAMKALPRPKTMSRSYYRADTPPDRSTQASKNPTAMHSLQETWTAGRASDQEKIEAVLARLRSEFVLDRSPSPENDSLPPVESFLLNKHGPSYLFATTAACMFQAMGLQSRVATGFYIADDDYDVEASHYAATSDNLHWWVQVQLADGTWLSFEPTPGFDPPREHWSWQERLAWGGGAFMRLIARHPLASLALVAAFVTAIARRRNLVDAVYTGAYRLASIVSEEQRLRWAMWLLEKRAALAGVARPASQTPKRWFPKLIGTTNDDRLAIEHLIAWRYQQLYAPGASKAIDREATGTSNRLAKAVLARWTVRNMRTAKRCPIHQGTINC